MNRSSCALALVLAYTTGLAWATAAPADAPTAPSQAEGEATPSPQAASPATPDARAVIAKVGGEEITYGELATMMNSSAVVGVAVPALGTAERQRASIVLLDKVISANLLYLDALRQGADKDSEYQRDLAQFENGILASLYRRSVLLPKVEPSAEDVEAAFKASAPPGAQPTEDDRLAIASALRRDKLAKLKETERALIREGLAVSVVPEALDPQGDALRSDSDPVATLGEDRITWGEAKGVLQGASRRSAASGGILDARKEREAMLDTLIDSRAMALKARAAGLDRDPMFRARLKEFRKTSLINHYREQVLHRLVPSQGEIEAYFEKNQDAIRVPEERKIQMVVLKTKEEAEGIKQRIESGEITLYEAAADYSIDPRAKDTLGEMDWVAKGTGFPELDALSFSLAPEALGGPVESPAGWHLVKVLEIRPAQYTRIGDEQTAKLVRRRMMHERLDAYLVGLRNSAFEVVVDDERLRELFAAEAAWIASLEEKAQAPDSLTKRRTEEMTRMLHP